MKGYDFEKALNENSKHMTRMKKKYKNYKFSTKEILDISDEGIKQMRGRK